MAINKKLIHFKNKQKFEEELANNNILNTSICFIQDTKEIWTHGTIYCYNEWAEVLPIIKTKSDNTNIVYGTCSTSASTKAKVINIEGNENWQLAVGSVIMVKFSSTNTASNPTFNVNDTGAKPVIYNTSTITTSSLSYAGYANRTIEYVYNGTGYVFLGWSYNTAYSSMTASEATTGTSTTARLISPKVLDDKIMELIDANKSETAEVITEETVSNWGFAKQEDVDLPQINQTELVYTIQPNVFNVWGEVASLDITLGEEQEGIVNEFLFQFTSGETPTTLILPDTIKWVNDAPEIEANMTYQCSIINNLGIICGAL